MVVLVNEKANLIVGVVVNGVGVVGKKLSFFSYH